jgi:hypothetical protein
MKEMENNIVKAITHKFESGSGNDVSSSPSHSISDQRLREIIREQFKEGREELAKNEALQ